MDNIDDIRKVEIASLDLKKVSVCISIQILKQFKRMFTTVIMRKSHLH